MITSKMRKHASLVSAAQSLAMSGLRQPHTWSVAVAIHESMRCDKILLLTCSRQRLKQYNPVAQRNSLLKG